MLSSSSTSSPPSDSSSIEVHSFHVFDGDVFHMFGDCQESYQHCVMKSEGENNNQPRVSIVFKKSIPQANGRRGHGVKKKVVNEKSSLPAVAVDKGRISSRREESKGNFQSKRTSRWLPFYFIIVQLSWDRFLFHITQWNKLYLYFQSVTYLKMKAFSNDPIFNALILTRLG